MVMVSGPHPVKRLKANFLNVRDHLIMRLTTTSGAFIWRMFLVGPLKHEHA